jgi:UDP-N-acetylmuramate: L-alanyl-gamma-D-glutamyl-meso-diaminopimelate ligase
MGSAALDRVLARGCWSPTTRFGPGGDWQAGPIAADGSFAVQHVGREVGSVQWSLIGEFNSMNALNAIAAAHHIGVKPAAAIAALSTFQGVKRRLEQRGTVRGITVYDDFAHHPTAIAVTLSSLRQRFGKARILAVLEPRSNTMKLGTMAQRLPAALTDADHIFCFGTHRGKHALAWDPVQLFAPLGARASSYDDLETLIAAIVRMAQTGDHILIMSNGSFGGIHEKLLKALAQAAGNAPAP